MLLISFATYPEYLKIKPILRALSTESIQYKLLQVVNNDSFIIKEPHAILELGDISSYEIDNVLLNVVDQAENWLKDADTLLVPGDSEASFSMALAAFNRRLKVIHLGAGLRTWNLDNFPEEFNRQAISRLTSIHLCSSSHDAKNLAQEGIRAPKFIVGSTILDLIDNTVVPGDTSVLISLKDKDTIDKWYTEFTKLAIIYPYHQFIFIDNHSKRQDLLRGIKIIDKLTHKDFIMKLRQCSMVISDSNIIQEEACYLRKKMIICKKITERPQSIWLNASMCKNPDYLLTAFKKMIDKTIEDYLCPFGDGKATEKIIEILGGLE